MECYFTFGVILWSDPYEKGVKMDPLIFLFLMIGIMATAFTLPVIISDWQKSRKAGAK